MLWVHVFLLAARECDSSWSPPLGFDPVEIRVGRRGKPIEPSRAPQGA